MWQAAALTRFERLGHVFTPAGYNISLRSGPNHSDSAARRAQLADSLGAAAGLLRAGDQVHGVDIASVRGANAEACVTPSTDGLVTNTPGVTLLAQTADCPLVLLYSPARHALALGHSGWRGTFAGMPTQLTCKLSAEFGVDPGDVIAVVAPSAGACCYEIRDDVFGQLAAFRKDAERFVRRADGRMYLDLGELIATQLVESGLSHNSVHLPAQCSICDERFYSYRRQGAGGGHAALAACLH
jgi:YfiH family protein